MKIIIVIITIFNFQFVNAQNTFKTVIKDMKTGDAIISANAYITGFKIGGAFVVLAESPSLYI